LSEARCGKRLWPCSHWRLSAWFSQPWCPLTAAVSAAGAATPPPPALAATMRKEAIATWLRIASRRTTVGEYDEFRSAVSRRQQSERTRRFHAGGFFFEPLLTAQTDSHRGIARSGSKPALPSIVSSLVALPASPHECRSPGKKPGIHSRAWNQFGRHRLGVSPSIQLFGSRVCVGECHVFSRQRHEP
jgi:hypothetical protein